jgi:hypothetical protein
VRARLLEAATDRAKQRRDEWRAILVGLWCFGVLVALEVLRRTFRGFGWECALAPVMWIVLLLLVHFEVWHRPFSLSAMDDVHRHLWRLGLTALGSGLVASGLASAAGGMLRGDVTIRDRIARASGALAAVAILLALLAVAWTGGALGPWPLGDRTLYAMVLAPLAMAGACLAAVATITVAKANRHASWSGARGPPSRAGYTETAAP